MTVVRPVLLLAVLVSTVAWLNAQDAAPQPGAERAWSFDDAMPAEAQVTGDAALADAPEGAGRCLRVGRDAEVYLPFSDQACHGVVRMKVYDSGFAREGDAAVEYAFGPLWGVHNTGGDRFVIGEVWAPFVDGNSGYTWVSTAQNGFFDRWSAGLARQPGWHEWEFIIGLDATVRVLLDGQEAPSIDPAGTGFGQGFNGIYLRGAKDVDEPLFVDDIAVTFIAAKPERVLKPFPRTNWPLPSTHPVRPDPAWTRGYPQDPGFFPIAVWCQDPKNAARYKDAGINLYVALWEGPTEEQLAALRAAGMRAICDQNEVGLAHMDDDTIVGWMHGDEPDNAQAVYNAQGEMTGYGPPVPPARIVESYRSIKQRDPSRPVVLNLGQGIANGNWRGRGSEGKPEDYDTYVLGADILSFDIYPVADTELAAGDRYLWLVPKGVDRLRGLTGNGKILWNALECTRIGNTRAKPSPEQVRAEAWMSIIHGSTGLIWFVHQFEPTFIEAALFEDPDVLAEVSAINHRLQELAPVLNSPTRAELVDVTTDPDTTPVDVLAKQYEGETFVFAVAMQDAPTRARFTVEGLPAECSAEVLGEDRSLAVQDGVFEDDFRGYAVHLYRIPPR